MSNLALFVVAFLVLFALGAAAYVALTIASQVLRQSNDRIERTESAPLPLADWEPVETLLKDLRGEIDNLVRRVDGLESGTKDITLAVSEGIERVDRSERRVRAVVRSARKELAAEGFEHPGLEAENRELQLVDGGGSSEGEVPTLPEEVAAAGGDGSSIAGVSAEALRRARAH